MKVTKLNSPVVVIELNAEEAGELAAILGHRCGPRFPLEDLYSLLVDNREILNLSEGWEMYNAVDPRSEETINYRLVRKED